MHHQSDILRRRDIGRVHFKIGAVVSGAGAIDVLRNAIDQYFPHGVVVYKVEVVVITKNGASYRSQMT